jgi:4-amino-4-deoxy-L-arabinose transferase-like glycosyltransferase
MLLARSAAPRRPALAAVAGGAAALQPQFIYTSGSITNDAAAAATCGVALWLLARVRCVRDAGPFHMLVLGVALGLAALSKASAVLLLVLTLAVILGRALRGPGPARLRWLGAAALVALSWAGVAGWWYARNLLLYGEPTGVRLMLSIQGVRATPTSPLDVVRSEGGEIWLSWWSQFGWSSVAAPTGVYVLAAVLSAAALAGLLSLAVSRVARQRALGPGYAIGLPVLWLLLVFASLLTWSAATYASYGRLLYPAYSAATVLLALGWLNFGPRAAVVACSLLVPMALAAPFVLLAAY